MTEVTISIPDEKLPFFMLLAKELNFVIVDKKKAEKKMTAKQKKFVEDFKQSLKEVELHTQGKIKLKSAEEFLNEL